ncbi:hypothetical protein P9112_002739 [Eukaryota sp. TZLM1-RC]
MTSSSSRVTRSSTRTRRSSHSTARRIPRPSPTPTPTTTPAPSPFASHPSSAPKRSTRPLVLFGQKSPIAFPPSLKILVKADYFAAMECTQLIVQGPNIDEILKVFVKSDPISNTLKEQQFQKDQWTSLVCSFRDCLLSVLREHLKLIFYPIRDNFDEFRIIIGEESDFDSIIRKLRVHHLLRLLSLFALITARKFSVSHFSDEECAVLSHLCENLLYWLEYNTDVQSDDNSMISRFTHVIDDSS